MVLLLKLLYRVPEVLQARFLRKTQNDFLHSGVNNPSPNATRTGSNIYRKNAIGGNILLKCPQKREYDRGHLGGNDDFRFFFVQGNNSVDRGIRKNREKPLVFSQRTDTPL
jgi:hypothetical protein